MRALVPEVLRTEAQFRLLFAGQVLSLLGDRVMLVALPFAVLEAGGSIGAVGLVVAAQFLPFLVFALPAGCSPIAATAAGADRLRRRAARRAGDRRHPAGDRACTPLLLGVLAAFYGTADAFFQPAFTGLLPRPCRTPASCSRPTRCAA